MTIEKFLSVDHINNDGYKHRTQRGRGSDKLIDAVIREGYPITYQILCHNCNGGRSRNNGICPHQEQEAVFDAFYKVIDNREREKVRTLARKNAKSMRTSNGKKPKSKKKGPQKKSPFAMDPSAMMGGMPFRTGGKTKRKGGGY